MKKVYLALIILVLFGCCYGCRAQENTENKEIINETSASNFFDEKVLPLIIDYGVVVLGVVSSLAAILSKVNKSRKTFEVANDSITALKAQLIDERETIKKKQAEMKAKSDEIEKKENEILEMKTDLKTLKEICMIAFLNNKDLVANGYAKDIAKVVEGETKN